MPRGFVSTSRRERLGKHQRHETTESIVLVSIRVLYSVQALVNTKVSRCQRAQIVASRKSPFWG